MFSFLLLFISNISAQHLPEANFPVFTQSVSESDSIVTVQIALTSIATDSGWIQVIQEVSSTVNFEDDLIFENPYIVECFEGDSIIEFEIGIVDDAELERSEQIMLAIESTSDNLTTGPDGEHVVFIYDNDCQLNINDLELEYCLDAAPILLEAHPPGGYFEGENIVNNYLYALGMEVGEYNIRYILEMEAMCQDTLDFSITLLACDITDTGFINEPSTRLHFYPNPASDFLYIETVGLHSKINLELVDNMGHSTKINASENLTQLDVSSYSTGLYFLIYKDETGKVLTSKIYIE